MTWHILEEHRTAVCMGYLPDIPGLEATRTRVQGKPVTLVPHTLEHYAVLRQHGLKVPVPMYEYGWKGRFSPREYQRKTTEFLIENKKAFCLNGLGCVDASTEYLSPTGWCRIDQYDGGQVAQYHPDTGQIEYVQPTEYVKKPCPEMIRFKCKGVDQLLSPEHRVLLYWSPNDYHVANAEWVEQALMEREDVGLIYNGEGYLPLDCLPRREPSPDGHKYCFMVPSTFLILRRNGCIFATGNTGKTLCGIWGMDYLMEQNQVRRTLIVAPKTICSHVWERELFKTLPHYRKVVLHGTADRKRQMARDTRFDVIICNPESLHLIVKDLPGVDLVIVDEFTKFKNARSRRWKALRQISKDKRLWLFSGTPAPQGPLDAHGPIALVREDRFPYLQWRDKTMRQVTSFKWVARDGAEQTIMDYMQPAIRYRREDCYDMPDVDVQELEVDLTGSQEKAIEGFKQEAAARFEEDDRTITAATAAAAISKILQVMGGGVYDEDREVVKVDAAPFFDEVETVVDQADTPVVIFLPFRSSATAVHEHLLKAGYRSDLIMGGVNNRSEIFDKFKRGDLDALVAVAGTMSHGVDGLQEKGRYILWAQPPFSYEEYEQANGRLIRSGQKNNVVIYHLIQNGLARELFARLKSKRKLQDTVLDLIGGATK